MTKETLEGLLDIAESSIDNGLLKNATIKVALYVTADIYRVNVKFKDDNNETIAEADTALSMTAFRAKNIVHDLVQDSIIIIDVSDDPVRSYGVETVKYFEAVVNAVTSVTYSMLSTYPIDEL